MSPTHYLLFGEETYFLKQFLDKLRLSFPEAEFKTRDGSSITEKELITSCTSLPFFNTKQIIHLPGIFDNIVLDPDNKALQQILSKPPGHLILVFSHSGKTPDKRKKMYKILLKNSTVQEFTPLKGYQLRSWIEKEFIKQKGLINPSGIAYLESFVGNDLWQLSKEIEKLCLYGQGKMITEKEIENITIASKEAIVFDFVDSLGEKKPKKALELLHNLVHDQKESVLMMGMIVRQIRLIMQCLSLKKTYGYDWKNHLALNPFVAEKIEQQSRHFTLEKLQKIYQRLYDFDKKMKSTSQSNPLSILDYLTIELTQ